MFLDSKYRVREKVITVPKKTLFLVLPYLGPLSLQIRTKLRKSLKGILNCCKIQIVFKSQNKLAKALRFKDRIPKELTSSAVYKFQCGFCNESYYDECVRHPNVRIEEHIGISRLTKKKVKPKGSAVSDHLLLCNHSPSFENFSVLTKENKKFLLELKESLLIMRDKPSLNRNIRSAPLYLFDKVWLCSPFGELNSWILIILIVTSFTFIGKCLNKLKLDICICSSQDIAIALCLVMAITLISFFCFFVFF